MQERLTQLLALLPSRGLGSAEPYSADHLDGQLCAALCLQTAEEPVAVLDAYWGEDWAEALMEQELLDEFMSGVEERWEALQQALDLQQLDEDPDALPLAAAFSWAGAGPGTQLHAMPAAAKDWAAGFVSQAKLQAGMSSDLELLNVVAALMLEDGPPLQSYLREAYETPQDIGAAALIDDALFAAQDLRRTTR